MTAKSEVVDWAMAWWEGKRPVGWSFSEHLDNPSINCVTDTEKRLAEAVGRCWRPPRDGRSTDA